MTDAKATARRMLKKNQQYLSTQQMKTLNGLINRRYYRGHEWPAYIGGEKTDCEEEISGMIKS